MRVRAIHRIRCNGQEHSPGSEFDLDRKVAEADGGPIDRGAVEVVQAAPAKQAKAKKEKTSKGDGVQSDLPEDFPGREALAAAGVRTLDAVQEIENLTEIDGIGEATAAAIEKALEQAGGEES